MVHLFLDNRIGLTIGGELFAHALALSHFIGDLSKKVPNLHDVVAALGHTERLPIDLFRGEMHSPTFVSKRCQSFGDPPQAIGRSMTTSAKITQCASI